MTIGQGEARAPKMFTLPSSGIPSTCSDGLAAEGEKWEIRCWKIDFDRYGYTVLSSEVDKAGGLAEQPDRLLAYPYQNDTVQGTDSSNGHAGAGGGIGADPDMFPDLAGSGVQILPCSGFMSWFRVAPRYAR